MIQLENVDFGAGRRLTPQDIVSISEILATKGVHLCSRGWARNMGENKQTANVSFENDGKKWMALYHGPLSRKLLGIIPVRGYLEFQEVVYAA